MREIYDVFIPALYGMGVPANVYHLWLTQHSQELVDDKVITCIILC